MANESKSKNVEDALRDYRSAKLQLAVAVALDMKEWRGLASVLVEVKKRFPELVWTKWETDLIEKLTLEAMK